MGVFAVMEKIMTRSKAWLMSTAITAVRRGGFGCFIPSHILETSGNIAVTVDRFRLNPC